MKTEWIQTWKYAEQHTLFCFDQEPSSVRNYSTYGAFKGQVYSREYENKWLQHCLPSDCYNNLFLAKKKIIREGAYIILFSQHDVAFDLIWKRIMKNDYS